MAESPKSACGIDRDDFWLESLRGRRVFIETYGCRYNFGDTAKLVEILKFLGSTIVDSSDSADVVVVNTCTVVGSTERRMLRRLSLYRDRDLYVTGCLPAVQQDSIFAVCSPKIISPDSIQEVYRDIGTVALSAAGIVQVAQGCMGKCSYCITRKARGPLRSFPVDEILHQVEAFSRAGTAEIQLTAQDVSAWGHDIGKALPDLLNSISDLPGRFRLRVGMMNPATIRGNLEHIVDAFQDDKVFKFVHIPVQSGSDRILKAMNRGYTAEEFEEIIAAFKKRYPSVSIATDVIVGYPGETLQDFYQTRELISLIRPVKVNVTRYSYRPFTNISSGSDFPDSVKKDRSRNLNALNEEIYSSINEPLLGTIEPFIVTESIKSGSVIVRTPSYLGVVIKEDLPIGYEGKVALKRDRKYFFIGERVI
jgi:threonylcarbamoyladenosine tRNA methylthiotransferase CDKAL1